VGDGVWTKSRKGEEDEKEDGRVRKEERTGETAEGQRMTVFLKGG
jgi:hypothetical protein